MGTITEKLQKLLDTKNAIKAAIIAKGQSVSDSDTFASYADKISAIETGTDTSDATITATDVRTGKIGYGAGGKVVGTVVDVEAATPDITCDTNGLITASSNQSGGFVTAATKTVTKQLQTLGATTYTPGTTQKTISPQVYLTGTQTIQGDANLAANNIKNGVSIFGVTGTVQELKRIPASLTVTNSCGYKMWIYYPDTDNQYSNPGISNGASLTISTYVGACVCFHSEETIVKVGTYSSDTVLRLSLGAPAVQMISSDNSATSVTGSVSIVAVSAKEAATVKIRCYTSDDMYAHYQTADGSWDSVYMSYNDTETVTTYVGAWIYGQVDGSGTLAYNTSGARTLGPGDSCVVEVTNTTATVYFTDL